MKKGVRKDGQRQTVDHGGRLRFIAKGEGKKSRTITKRNAGTCKRVGLGHQPCAITAAPVNASPTSLLIHAISVTVALQSQTATSRRAPMRARRERINVACTK